MSKFDRQAQELASRPYTSLTIRDINIKNEAIYVAKNPELPGCTAQGGSVEEAIANLNDVRVDYIEHLLEHGLSIPGPRWLKSDEPTKLQDKPIEPLESGGRLSLDDVLVEPPLFIAP